MKITVIGTGWVELVFGACLADTGKGLQLCPDLGHGVEYGTIQVIGVGTTPDEGGSADVQYVLAGAGYGAHAFRRASTC